MKCLLIQAERVKGDNRGELAMLHFLQNLNDSFIVYRELNLTPAYYERVRGMKKKKPDFVVLSSDTGLISIEVKDWDLSGSTYTWRDQQKIIVMRAAGKIEEITNPRHQADSYEYALAELVGRHAFVTSLVAFPRLSRMDFENRIAHLNVLNNPQSKFFLDLDTTIFKEDVDKFRHQPSGLLEAMARKNPRFRTSKRESVQKIHEILLPPAFRIDDMKKRQRGMANLSILSDRQQKWIFDEDLNANYLLDVAGSGKTNVLISKAMHLVDRCKQENLPKILITTYSDNLATNLKLLFASKADTHNNSNNRKYLDAITIKSIPELMEEMFCDFHSKEDMNSYRRQSGHADLENKLREEIKDILDADPERYRRFDYIFVDEIQDFDNLYLLITKHLCKARNFFFVGDIGQKLYDRTHDLTRLGIVPERIELPKSYTMYRTPKHIAKLATDFLFNNPYTKDLLEKYGYRKDQMVYRSEFDNRAEMRLFEHSIEPCFEVAERINSILNGHHSPDDIMIITDEERVGAYMKTLRERGIPSCTGKEDRDTGVIVVDFVNCKGLEKEVVIIDGVDRLPNGSQPSNFNLSIDKKVEEETLSRRKAYTALTRTMEQLIIYFANRNNKLMQELLSINDKLSKTILS